MSEFRRFGLWSALVAFAFLGAACGGGIPPTQEVTSAKAAVSGAEVGGAGENPKAAFHLKKAKEQIAETERLIEEGDNEEATRMIARAQADADLALSLAKEGKAKAEAMEAQEQLDKLQKKAK